MDHHRGDGRTDGYRSRRRLARSGVRRAAGPDGVSHSVCSYLRADSLRTGTARLAHRPSDRRTFLWHIHPADDRVRTAKFATDALAVWDRGVRTQSRIVAEHPSLAGGMVSRQPDLALDFLAGHDPCRTDGRLHLFRYAASADQSRRAAQCRFLGDVLRLKRIFGHLRRAGSGEPAGLAQFRRGERPAGLRRPAYRRLYRAGVSRPSITGSTWASCCGETSRSW